MPIMLHFYGRETAGFKKEIFEGFGLGRGGEELGDVFGGCFEILMI